MIQVVKLVNVKVVQLRTISREVKIQYIGPKEFKKIKENLIVVIKTIVAKSVWRRNLTKDVFASCQKIGAEINCLQKDVNFVVVVVVIHMKMSRDHLQLHLVINQNKVRM